MLEKNSDTLIHYRDYFSSTSEPGREMATCSLGKRTKNGYNKHVLPLRTTRNSLYFLSIPEISFMHNKYLIKYYSTYVRKLTTKNTDLFMYGALWE